MTYQRIPSPCRRLAVLLLLLQTTIHSGWLQAAPGGDELLEEEAYRSDLEEVIVVGQPPEWRRSQLSEQEWRPEKFELPESTDRSRINWFPEYTREERDKYLELRKRPEEDPQIKLFEWKF